MPAVFPCRKSEGTDMAKMILFAIAIFAAIMAPCAFAEQTLTASKIAAAPIIDGKADEPLWQEALPVITHDNVADIDVELRAVYSEDMIFFLVKFPDGDESRTHKSWVWNPSQDIYEVGKDREDVFIFKWNTASDTIVDMRLDSEDIYAADEWFWKAWRSDPAGFSDDKFQIISSSKREEATELTTRSDKTMYLQRLPDKGRTVFETVMPEDFTENVIPRFRHVAPTESCADIPAKGAWQEGAWTIEFARKLKTGNDDDVQFSPGARYQFGISRYEIAGRKPEQDLTQPLYGCGDVSEDLYLVFAEK